MNFLDHVLTFMADTVKNDEHAYVFEWSRGSSVSVTRTQSPQYQFLPDWFLNPSL